MRVKYALADSPNVAWRTDNGERDALPPKGLGTTKDFEPAAILVFLLFSYHVTSMRKKEKRRSELEDCLLVANA